MRVALVCNEYPPLPHGGIGTFIHAFAHGFALRGHGVTVVGMGNGSGAWNDGLIRVVQFPQCTRRGAAWVINRIQISRYLYEQWRAGEIDLVETPEYQGWLPFGLGACPVVVRLHLAHTAIARHAGTQAPATVRLCEYGTLRANRNWIAVSEYALELTRRTFLLDPAHSRRIFNPVAEPSSDARPPPGLPPGRFVLFAGALSRRKGAFVVAEAARRFLLEVPDLRLVYAGLDPMEEGVPSLQRIRQILGAGLAGRVDYLGVLQRDAVLEAMSRAEAFLFPSTLETFGLTAGEAMLVGCPVIASNQAPFTEFIEDGKNGLLVDPGNPAEISERVTRLLGEPALKEELSKAARATVASRLTLEANIRETEGFYAEVLDSWSHR